MAFPLARRSTGTAFEINHRVTAHGRAGTVVGNITTGEYAPAQRTRAWGNLGAGLLVQWDDGTVTHYREPCISLRHHVDRPAVSTRGK
jgi:hypothetical protein